MATKITKTFVEPVNSEDRVNVIIVDDSVLSRNRFKKVELLTKVFDPAHHAYLYGFRMLSFSWSDGATILPVIASLLSSENEKQGSMRASRQFAEARLDKV